MKLTGLSKQLIERGAEDAKGRVLPLRQKAADLANRTIRIIGSTIHIDRDGEVILPSAYSETLPKFLASNAPFKAQHARQLASGAPTQIGWCMDAEIRGDEVEFGVRFATTDIAEEWWKLAADPQGKGIAASVGFRPVEYVSGTAGDVAKALPELAAIFGRDKVPDDQYLRVYTKIELYELSGCDIPSNRESLQVLAAKSVAGMDPAERQEAVENLKALLGPAIEEAVKAGLADLTKFIEEVRLLLLTISPDNVNPDSDGGRARPPEDEEDGGVDVQRATEEEASRKALLAVLRE